MPLFVVRNDITKMHTHAIVNAANETLLGGGGVDGAIHRAAGPELLEECRTLGGCRTGEAKITAGYRLNSRYVIHTVGPVWHGGYFGEERLLASCYRNCLKLAVEHHCETIAFPLISAGAYRYPKDKALRVAMDTITDFLNDNEIMVYLVVYDKDVFQISSRVVSELTSYIDDHYVDAHSNRSLESQRFPRMYSESDCSNRPQSTFRPVHQPVCAEKTIAAPLPGFSTGSLDDVLSTIDESFSEMLLRKIDEKGMKDSQCYKKANIDRKLFSKIRSDKFYKPSKPTVLSFAIALELPLHETKDMLLKAGFALSHSNKFDIIIEYFITRGNYNIHEINEALFAFDQSLLGG